MAVLTKTATQLQAPVSLASNTVAMTSAVDVSTKLAATVLVRHGRRATTALTEGVEYRIQGSVLSSGDRYWLDLAVFKSAIAASESEAVSGTVASGQKVITVASTTNLTVSDVIYIDNGTIANSEWHRIASLVASTSVTVEDNLTNAQTGATLYDQAEEYVAQVSLDGVLRLRVVANGDNSGQATAWEAYMATTDSFG